MKKYLGILLLATALMSSAASAQHGGWSHGGGYGYRGGFHGGYHDHFGRGAAFVTGAVVGAVITDAYVNRPYYYQSNVVYTRQVPVYCVNGYGAQYVCGWQTVPAYGP